MKHEDELIRVAEMILDGKPVEWERVFLEGESSSLAPLLRLHLTALSLPRPPEAMYRTDGSSTRGA